MRKKPLLCLNIYLWALFLVPIGLTIPLANLSTFSFLQYLFHFIVLSLKLMIKVNLHPNIFKIYDPLSQKHPDSRTCSVAKEQEWWHILWEYDGIREYAWFVPGDHWRYSQHCGYRLGFYRIGKYMLIDTKWCWEISEFGSITACNGQPIVC